MLTLEVSFLLGRYAATDYRDREQPEWPPHPSRLFSALVAAAYESGLGESARAALQWLERLPPPCLRADESAPAQTPITAYVPVNDPEGPPLPQRTERQPRGFPSVVPATAVAGEMPSVCFIWPGARPDAVLLDLLGKVAESVTYLGSSRSPVRVRLCSGPVVPNWFPDEAGPVVLRVPSQGRLESLDWHFQNGLRPTTGAFHRYRFGQKQDRPAPRASVHGEMVVYRLRGPVAMEIETTLKVTDVLRQAAMRHAQDVLGEVPEVLSGHDALDKPTLSLHAAYLALPFVSDTQQHADGRLLGVAVALPRHLPAQERRAAVRALVRVDHLLLPGVGRVDLERLTPEQVAPYNLRATTWAGPSRRWASATPVLLDRFPKRNGRGIEAIIARSCETLGLPRPVEVTTDRFSPLHGVERSSRFLTRRSTEAKPRLYTHVTLCFEEAVEGPVLLGAGRYFGLGLMRPLQEDAP